MDRPIFVLGCRGPGRPCCTACWPRTRRCARPVSWEVTHPFPPPTEATRLDDPRIAATEAVRPVPPTRARPRPHPPAGGGAATGMPGTALAGVRVLRVRDHFPVLEYWAWLRTQDLRLGYEMQRQLLQHLQSGYGGEHWILKTPGT